jgi:hypothetical protein
MSDDEPEGVMLASKVARLHPPGVPHRVTLDRAVQGAIGAELRRMYDQLVEQPIPDRLLDLVNRIAELDTGGEAGESFHQGESDAG